MNVAVETSPRENSPFEKGSSPSSEGYRPSAKDIGRTSTHVDFSYPQRSEFGVPIQKANKAKAGRSRQQTKAIPCPSLPSSEVWEDQLEAMIQHARLEAKSIAATTPFPSLFLPCLLDEKINQARDYTSRQRQVWKLSRDIRCLAV